MTRKQILEAADRCVNGERDQQYGSPENNFAAIAALWMVYHETKYRKPVFFTSDDVANMMALLKIARIASGQTKEDNYIDLAGYAACAGEIATEG